MHPREPEARDAYAFANFNSILLKTSHGATARLAGVGFFLLYMFPLAAAAVAGSLLRHRAGQRGDTALLLNGWVIAALLGYLAIPISSTIMRCRSSHRSRCRRPACSARQAGGSISPGSSSSR